MKHLLIVLALISMSACASAWVVRQTPDGGVVGYQAGGMFSTAAGLKEKIEQQIQCPRSYTVVADELKSSQSLSTTFQSPPPATLVGKNPLTRAAMEEQRANSVPVTNTTTEYWRELTYQCSPSK